MLVPLLRSVKLFKMHFLFTRVQNFILKTNEFYYILTPEGTLYPESTTSFWMMRV